MAGSVLTIVEQSNGKYKKSAFEVSTAGVKLAGELGCDAIGLVIGVDAPEDVGSLAAFGVKKIITAKNENCNQYNPEVFVQAVLAAIDQENPEVVLFSASATGKDLAPRVAAKLGVGLTSDITNIEVVDGNVQVTRPVYAGKTNITIKFESSPKMATLRPNVFTPKEVAAGASGEISDLHFEQGEIKAVVKEFRKTGGDKVELTEAEIIVSGGRGIKGPENFVLLEELAHSLGAAVGASRAVVDAGWRPHSDQVGQTGKTVAPNLYIAAGISGAIQHLAGMSSSKVIVAINKDPDAPIFTRADYGIIGDLFQIVPALTEEIKKMKS